MKDEKREPTPLPSLNEETPQDIFGLPVPMGPMGNDAFLHKHDFDDAPIAIVAAVQLRQLDEVTPENQHHVHTLSHYVEERCDCGEKHAMIQVHYFARTHELAKHFEERIAEVAMELGLLDRRHGGAAPN